MIITVKTGEAAPPTFLLSSMRRQGMAWASIFGELIDNSLDAGANDILITIAGDREFHLSDNGCGCADVKAMIVPGVRFSHATTESGQFGIGLKDAALALWGEIDITSRKSGETRRIQINWERMFRANSAWVWPDHTLSDEDDRPSGTELKFRKIDKEIPSVSEIENMVGFTFAPALRKAELRIRIEKKQRSLLCSPKEMPPMTDIVEETFVVKGKEVSLRAGIVADGIKNDWPGFVIEKAHRVVEKEGISTNGFSARRVAGRVVLGKGWSLDKHKKGVICKQELQQAVFSRVEHILRKSEEQVQEVALKELATRISLAISGATGAVTNGKERRKGPEHHDGPHPGGSGESKPRRARKIQPGEKKIKAALARGLAITWADRIDGGLIATVLLRTTPQVVKLNLEHPAIRAARERDDQIGLGAMALTEYAHAYIGDPESQKLFREQRNYSDFPKFFASIMRQYAENMGEVK